MAAITGAKKFKEKAIKKLVRLIEIFRSVSNSSFIISFILFKTNKLNNNAKMKAGIEKRIHWNNIIKITFFFEFPTSLKTPNSNELVSVVINSNECINIKLNPNIPNNIRFKIRFNKVVPYLNLFIAEIKGIFT